jgi:NarL family two-component system sensor histidine kinase LiaS
LKGRLNKIAGGIKAKLAWTYVAATAGTLTVLAAIILIFAYLRFADTFRSPQELVRALDPYLPAVATLLNKDQDNREALTNMFDAVIREQVEANKTVARLNIEGVITDANGYPVVISKGSRWSYQGGLARQLPDKSRRVLMAALEQKTSEQELAVTLADNKAAFAVPVLDARERLLGVVYAEVDGSLHRGLFQDLFTNFGPIALTTLLVSSVISVGLGSLFSKPLTDRLHRIKEASNQWRQGVYSHPLTVGQSDELGELESALNIMALDLKGLLEERERLASERERDRLTRDLHDTVKQHAFAASLQIAIADKAMPADAPAKENLRNAALLVERARRDLVAMLTNPPETALDGAVTDLGKRIREWESHSGIRVKVELQETCRLTGMARTAVLRIVDEALSNVARHSGASEVGITLTCKNELIHLCISDNGSGFDEAKIKRGMGLTNMKARAESLVEGKLDIVVTPGMGTTIRAQFRTEAL